MRKKKQNKKDKKKNKKNKKRKKRMNSVRKFVKKVLKRVAYHLTKEKKHRLTVKKKEGGGLPPPKKRKKTKSLERLAAMVWLAGCYGSAGFGSPFRPPPPFPQHLYKAPQGPLFETTRSLSCHGSRPMTYWFASGTMLGTTTRLQSCNLGAAMSFPLGCLTCGLTGFSK